MNQWEFVTELYHFLWYCNVVYPSQEWLNSCTDSYTVYYLHQISRCAPFSVVHDSSHSELCSCLFVSPTSETLSVQQIFHMCEPTLSSIIVCFNTHPITGRWYVTERTCWNKYERFTVQIHPISGIITTLVQTQACTSFLCVRNDKCNFNLQSAAHVLPMVFFDTFSYT